MPIANEIEPRGEFRRFEYSCTCGRKVIMETDAKERPKKLYKCWDCQLTDEEVCRGRKMPGVRK